MLPSGPSVPYQLRVPDRARRLGNRGARPGQRDRPRRHADLRRLWASYPHAELEASGPSVGLPEGQMGNSEVGHLTLGAGAAVPQTLTLINNAVADGALAANAVLREALSAARAGPPARDGVGRRRAFRLRPSPRADRARRRARGRDLVLHCFTDGRDTSPTAGRGLPGRARGLVRATRAPAASRPSSGATARWTATGAGIARRHAYDLLVARTRPAPLTGRAGGRARRLRARRDRRVHHGRRRSARRRESDPGTACLLQLPPRPDARDRARARRARLRRRHEDLPGWHGRGGAADPAAGDHDRIPAGLALPGRVHGRASRDTIGAVIEAAGERQLHVAETEKYAHVTYFFNGGARSGRIRRATGAGALASATSRPTTISRR